MTMENWITKLNGFPSLNERDILTHAGKISHEIAKEFAEKEYKKFYANQIKLSEKTQSDFDKTVKMIEDNKKALPVKPKKKGVKKKK